MTSPLATGRADLHVHPLARVEGAYDPAPWLQALIQSGLDVVAITEHDRVDLAQDLRARMQRLNTGPQIIMGAEITTQEGHLLGLFLHEDVPYGLSLAEAVRAVHDQHGIAVIAHPLLPSASCVSGKNVRNLMQHSDHECHADAIETFNSIGASIPLYVRRMRSLSRDVNRASVGGSDAHHPDGLGMGITTFAGKTGDDLREAILANRTRSSGKAAESLWRNVLAMPRRWHGTRAKLVEAAKIKAAE